MDSPSNAESRPARRLPENGSATNLGADSTTRVVGSRNRNRQGTWRAGTAAPAGRPEAPRGRQAAPTVRGTWVEWLAPHFTGNSSAYFTGTYSDEYGTDYGLMLPRNVHKDVLRFLDREIHPDLGGRRFICGVEQHQFRDILHWHGIIEGPFSEAELDYLKGMWSLTRGHARVLPVTDGCASYVTKYALKGDTDSFEWRLA